VGLKIVKFLMHFWVFYVFCRPVYARAIKWPDHPVKQTCKVQGINSLKISQNVSGRTGKML